MRSLHLHCYAGAAIVDKERKAPGKAEDWAAYLKKHYRPNSCALAMSEDDEVGKYLGWGKPWEKSEWPELLKGSPSIDALKKRLLEDKQFHPVALSTSDYLVKDLARYQEAQEPQCPQVRDAAFKCRRGFRARGRVQEIFQEPGDREMAQARRDQEDLPALHLPLRQAPEPEQDAD